MGGEFTETMITLKETECLRDRFQKIVEEAQYDHGHSGYSGTFAEKPGITIVQIRMAEEDQVNLLDGRYWTRDGAYNHAMEHNDKWENASAYMLGPHLWYIAGWCSS